MAKREKIREVILPKWSAWLFSIIMILSIIFTIYVNTFSEEKIPIFGLILLISIFLILILIFFLSAYKGLPIYYLKEK
ncbi:MAG: hypothetical protein QXQ14_01900 [Candidatus Aenigmatarchaeota archaeon]